jgi:serine/threonine-protein kinase RsbT
MRSHDGILLGVLVRYVSSINAAGMLRRAMRDAHLNSDRVGDRDLPRVIKTLTSGMRLFVDETRRQQLSDELNALVAAGPTRMSFEIADEKAAALARTQARVLCEQVGARALDCQKVATAVSELARNIVSYAGRGQIELELLKDPERMRVCAVDSGPGIRDLPAVLGGTYRSKTGLGRGLLSVKGMALRFEITSSASGTRVEFEYAL